MGEGNFGTAPGGGWGRTQGCVLAPELHAPGPGQVEVCSSAAFNTCTWLGGHRHRHLQSLPCPQLRLATQASTLPSQPWSPPCCLPSLCPRDSGDSVSGILCVVCPVSARFTGHHVLKVPLQGSR
jgi:hypothetical protein